MLSTSIEGEPKSAPIFEGTKNDLRDHMLSVESGTTPLPPVEYTAGLGGGLLRA